MNFAKSFEPNLLLKGIVKRVTVFRFTTNDPRGPINPFPPLSDQCLYFYPLDRVTSYNYASELKSNQPASIVVGPQTKRVDLQLGTNMLVIIVALYPGSLYRLTGVPMHDTLNLPLDSRDLLPGPEINEVQDRICHTDLPESINDVVQRFLIKWSSTVKPALPVDKAMAHLHKRPASYTVDELASDACVSTRQLERQFKERIGMSPKIFLRLVRFSKAWLSRECNSSLSWLDIANISGYADQMHMIRDFRQFASVNPSSIEKDLYNSPLRLQADLHR